MTALSSDASAVRPGRRGRGQRHGAAERQQPCLLPPYDDQAPIVSISDAHVHLAVSVPDPGQVTDDDVGWGRLLAEAVGRYVAELERRAAATREIGAGPADAPGRRRDGTADAGGAAGAGTSGRPWFLSRGKPGRGDHRMRKVVTGEQVAQLYNRDPFALPIWRAPVYQTPFGIILLVKLARLLAWLVRLAVRHPAATGVLAVLALMWINVGWVGLAALVAWVPWSWRPGGSSGRPPSPAGSAVPRGASGGPGGATGAGGPE